MGGDPFATTCVYGMIQHLERPWGVWFPHGAAGAPVATLGGLMRHAGAAFRAGATASRIETRGGRAVGMALEGGGVLAAEVLVANADRPAVYRRMPPGASRRRWTGAGLDRPRHSMGLFVLYFGVARRWPEVAHRTILPGPRHRGLLEDVFRRGVLAEDTGLHLHRPTATDPSLVPPGQGAL